MIVTVTLNPSLDRAVEVDALDRGEVHPGHRARLDPGGKGVNVSRALLRQRRAAHSSAAVRRRRGRPARPAAQGRGRRGRSRCRSPAGPAPTSPWPSPTARSPRSTSRARPMSRRRARRASSTAVLAGRQRRLGRAVRQRPPGLPRGRLRRAVPSSCARVGVRVAVDTSGPALRGGAGRPAPTLVKPNRDELAEVVGCALTDLADVVEAAQRLRDWGAGAVAGQPRRRRRCARRRRRGRLGERPVARPRSTVGAGDALLAGFLAAGAHGARRPRRGPGLGRRRGAPARQPDAAAQTRPDVRRNHVSRSGPASAGRAPRTLQPTGPHQLRTKEIPA